MKDDYPVLSKVNSPQDLKLLPERSLPDLASDIRRLIIEVVRRNGGHLASNLGVVELTIALHRVFASPRDKLIWDVGHQCYTHKILTGRRDTFSSLRKLNGLSGFPKPAESVHDIVETGHSSTSISAALGILIGQKIQGDNGKVVAVIGDGALTGGIALEGLNQAGHLSKGLIIVVNDNNMSIGENVGAISAYLSSLTTTTLYQSLRRILDRTVQRIPIVGNDLNLIIRQLEKGARAIVLPDTLFFDFGFHYVGPINGHDMHRLMHVFRNVRRLNQPVVVHVKTVKGKGYSPAEKDPTIYHGIAPFSNIDGKLEKRETVTFTEAFSGLVVSLAEENRDLVGISAAMTVGTGFSLFQEKFADRFFDVGITEQHAVTFAAGLARVGLKPLVAIYSTFMQRAVDQVIHDVALPGLSVIMALDRSGLVGEDGETHHGLFDIPLFKALPGLTMLAPAGCREMELMFRYALELGGPVMIRYPKAICSKESETLALPLVEGRGVFTRQEGGEILFLSLGGMLEDVSAAAELLSKRGIPSDIYNLRFIKPLDLDYLSEIAFRYARVFVVEEGAVTGGLGDHVCRCLRERHSALDCRCIGVPDRFICHGTRRELLELCGLDAVSLAAVVEDAMAKPMPLRIFRAVHLQ